MTYDEGVAHCAASGSTLAAIYDTSELAAARAAISAAGVEKAITSASSDGSGWAWHGTERWEESGFPLNTGQVTDQRQGMADHIYSLHRSEDAFVWDADGRGERHPVLCSTRQRFTVHLSRKSWADAEATCQAEGGTLANVVSASDNAAVAALFEGEVRFWLGASDQADEGVWRWTSSGTLPPTTAPNQAFSNWNSGEPNDHAWSSRRGLSRHVGGARKVERRGLRE